MHIRGIAGAFVGAIVAATIFTATPAAAQAGCGIQQAADIAVQRQIALLDAAKVDSSKYFNGADSCLGSNLLSSLDLSNLIPSSFDFLGNIGQNLIDNLIQKATQQVCKVLNSQIQEMITKINTQMGQFDSLIGSQMAELTGGSGSTSPISIPNVPGFGQYDFTSASADGGQTPTQPLVTPPAGDAGSNAARAGLPRAGQGGSGETGPTDLFDLFNR